MLIFGKLFHIFTILGTKENFLKSQWHLLFTNFRLWPLVILFCCFSKYKLTLPSYLLVKILYTSISHLTKKWSYFYASAAYTAAEALCFCLVRPGFCPLLMSVLCHQYFSRGNSGFCLTVFARNRDCSRKWRLRHWFVSLWRDPDDVPHCRILSPDKTERRLISRLHSADEDAVSWLTSYGSWHAYEKKEYFLRFAKLYTEWIPMKFAGSLIPEPAL